MTTTFRITLSRIPSKEAPPGFSEQLCERDGARPRCRGVPSDIGGLGTIDRHFFLPGNLLDNRLDNIA